MNCDFFAHGDDPCFNSDGVDITEELNKRGMFKLLKRTEGVSTTNITDKLVKLALAKIKEEATQSEINGHESDFVQ